MKNTTFARMTVSLTVGAMACVAAAQDIARYDPRMAVENAVTDTNGVKWIDGRYLPLEGKMFADTDGFYDRLPKGVTTNVNAGVRAMKCHTTGMQFRFRTDSKFLKIRWSPLAPSLAMDHMPSSGVSGIDIYRQDAAGKWWFVRTGRIYTPNGTCDLDWTPGTPCLINLPLYNGLKEFRLGVEPKASIAALPPRKSGVSKPVVFYGTSITHGGCASRPGLSFVNIVGRDLDVPVVNLGFSGSGQMELEMSEHLAAIDASCYVLDCLWNMGGHWADKMYFRYEPFIRNLRQKRPGVPIVMAERCDVFCGPATRQDRDIRKIYDKLIAEGWKDLVYLPKERLHADDLEGTVDGCHPNDIGMRNLATGFGGAVREALKLKPPKAR